MSQQVLSQIKMVITPKDKTKSPFGIMFDPTTYKVLKSPFAKWATEEKTLQEVQYWYLTKGCTIELCQSFKKVAEARNKQMLLPL